MNRLRRVWYTACQQAARVLFIVLFGIRVYHRRRLPARGGVLVVANHQSYLDPLVAAAGMRRPFHAMAMESLFRFAPLRLLIESLNAFPVRPDRADVRAVREALRRLRRGAVVLIFPEGSRTHDGSFGRLKGGAVVIAARAGVPIMPMVIDGAFEAWPRTHRLPRPHTIRVACGRPAPAKEVAGNEPGVVLAALRREMLTLQQELRRRRFGLL